MKKKQVNNRKDDFVDYEIWILTFGGAFQRANIYGQNVVEKDKAAFRRKIREKVKSVIADREYSARTPTTIEHIEVLTEVKKWIDDNFSDLLQNGEINLGVVQKIVNLYLKYQWCLGLVKKPPHCPFDRIIISKLELKDPPNWTEINKIDVYRMLVDRAEVLAGTKGNIADWELETFSRREE